MDPARPGVRVDSLHKQGTYYYLCDLPTLLIFIIIIVHTFTDEIADNHWGAILYIFNKRQQQINIISCVGWMNVNHAVNPPGQDEANTSTRH